MIRELLDLRGPLEHDSAQDGDGAARVVRSEMTELSVVLRGRMETNLVRVLTAPPSKGGEGGSARGVSSEILALFEGAIWSMGSPPIGDASERRSVEVRGVSSEMLALLQRLSIQL